MTKVVDLHHYRTKVVQQRAFGPWRKRFGETYDTKTRLSNLSDKTLYFLAQPGEDSSIAYYEVIMGVLDFGPATKFNYLASEQQMRVVDIHLFLADQMRFEMMRRMGWLEALPCQNIPIISMVQTYEQMRNRFKDNPPGLAASHPGHAAYQKLATRDKEVFIRQMLREALEKFEERIKS
jgi:hypothetical protein